MKKNCLKKATLFFVTLAMCFSFLSTPDLSVAAEPALHAATGQITGLQGTVITLGQKGVYYPLSEMYLPAWVKVGENASLLYARKGYTNYYYEIVQPGKKFTTLDARATAKKATR
ncbi:MAG: hypothetical protein JRI80_05770 [Deltaproteobacteria bacterium]|nr:hypothetical protein [Deltaproteobacteria bacterium]